MAAAAAQGCVGVDDCVKSWIVAAFLASRCGAERSKAHLDRDVNLVCIVGHVHVGRTQAPGEESFKDKRVAVAELMPAAIELEARTYSVCSRLPDAISGIVGCP